ncbi:hypothetical protein KDA08_04700 [Candidatus Saccharibacteria bacterium]|jgi:signal transduction histidine kinase|nr:hypothetical protein [Candidatus Saccharibacteria bacterium]MCA9313580.1 hypothetical protein [Candidatus Saccharibacteria bacterium]MDQ5969866.1 hypothetical protein [Patescibacteria group bacterium]
MVIKNRLLHILNIMALGIFIAILIPKIVLAQFGYNKGVYGDCVYGQECNDDQSPPTTVVPVAPSVTNPTSGRVIGVNLSNNQIIKSDNYTVIVTPNFSPDQIENVVLFVDDVVVGESSHANNNRYYIPWDSLVDGDVKVRVEVRLKDGLVIVQNFIIKIKLSNNRALSQNNISISDSSKSETTIKNIPIIGGTVNNLVQSTPTVVAYAIPYVFLSMLGFLAALMLYHAKGQLRYIEFLVGLLKRSKQIADEKTTFIMLVSHHLRTPITIIQGAVELAIMKDASDKSLVSVQEAVHSIHQSGEAILQDINNDQYLKNIEAPDVSKLRLKLYSSWQLILPVILGFGVLVLANYLYIVSDKVQLIIPNIMLQVVLFTALSVLLVNLFQRRKQRMIERGRLMQLKDHELALDKARNLFIKRTIAEISPLIRSLKDSITVVKDTKVIRMIKPSVGNLEKLAERLEFVSELEHGKVMNSLTNFDFRDIFENSIKRLSDAINQKGLRVTLPTDKVPVTQNKALSSSVMQMLCANAVQYSSINSSIEVKLSKVNNGNIIINLSNEGEGIPKEKLSYLFKPFSHPGSVEIFSEQGIGLSLYLSRLIMRYLGGEVTIDSIPKKLTTVSVEIPANASKLR